MNSRVLAILAVAVLALCGAFAWLVGGSGGESAALDAPESSTAEAAPTAVAQPIATAWLAPDEDRGARAPAAPETLRVRVVDAHGESFPAWTVHVYEFDEARHYGTAERAAYFGGRVKETGALDPPDLVLTGAGDEPVEIPFAFRARAPALVLRGVLAPRADMDNERARAVLPSEAGPIELVVERPVMLTIRVEGPLPVGLIDFSVTPVASTLAPEIEEIGGLARERNVAVFRLDHGVAYHVRVAGEQPNEVLELDLAPFERGERRTLPVRFPPGAVDVDLRPLALAGRIESAAADRPGLWATVDGGKPVSIEVAPDGTFELLHARGESVELHAAGDDFEARTDPAVSTHPFGTTGVVVRRRPASPRVRVRLTFVGAENGRPVRDTSVSFRLPGEERPRALELGVHPSGQIDISLPALDGLEYHVRANGRRDTTGRVYADGPPDPEHPVTRTIELEAGFRREFRVQDCVSHEPIANAAVEADGLSIGTSDARGFVVVELAAWPTRVVARAAGYEEGAWPPTWQAPLAATGILLCPSH